MVFEHPAVIWLFSLQLPFGVVVVVILLKAVLFSGAGDQTRSLVHANALFLPLEIPCHFSVSGVNGSLPLVFVSSSPPHWGGRTSVLEVFWPHLDFDYTYSLAAFFISFLNLIACVCVCVHARMWTCISGGHRTWLGAILLLLCRSQELKSSFQAWWQAPSPT